MAGGAHMKPTAASGDGAAVSPARAAASARRPRRRFAAVVRTLLAIALFVAGAAVYAWPAVDGWLAQRAAAQAVAAALAEDDAAAGSSATNAANNGATANKRPKDGDAAYQYLVDYNARVTAGDAGAFSDPWSASGDDELAAAGLAHDVIGSVSIPRLGETLPLYLGASQAHLAVGAAVADGTSAPLGQAGSNCVVAAHRGAIGGMPMFRDIESMEPGDLVCVETPWDTLTYRMVEHRVIAYTDFDAVRPVADRDLVTLLTCHPYGYNYQRYLVICERVDTAGADGGAVADASAHAENTAAAMSAATVDDSLLAALLRPVFSVLEPCDSWQLVLERWLRVAGLVLMVAVPVAGLVSAVRSRDRGNRGRRGRQEPLGSHGR